MIHCYFVETDSVFVWWRFSFFISYSTFWLLLQLFPLLEIVISPLALIFLLEESGDIPFLARTFWCQWWWYRFPYVLPNLLSGNTMPEERSFRLFSYSQWSQPIAQVTSFIFLDEVVWKGYKHDDVYTVDMREEEYVLHILATFPTGVCLSLVSIVYPITYCLGTACFR